MEYYSPTTLKELVNLVTKYKNEAVLVAGCTDILIKKQIFKDKKAIISTTEIKELQKIEQTNDKIRIGAGVTFSDLLHSDLIKTHCKALYNAAKVCGSLQIRNRATVAGNIINASPAADSIPPLMVSNACLILLSEENEEQINIKEFFTGPGKTKLKAGQIMTFIEFDKDTAETITFYRKIGTRKALSIAKASVAFKAQRDKGKLTSVQFAYGSVGPTVINSIKAKEYLENKHLSNESIEETSMMAFGEVSPIDDIRSTANYRRLVVKNVIIEELRQFM
jgi:CO/xanthine dehydrogenase FAD-binding subunit